MYHKSLIGLLSFLSIISISLSQPINARCSETPSRSKEYVPEPKIQNAAVVSKDSFDIFWTKRKNVDGYYICLIEKGKLKRLKTVKGADTSHCTVGPLSYNKQYHFCVRAFREEKGNTYRSNYDKKGFRARLAAHGEYKNGYKYFFDDNGNQVKNVEAFLEGPKDFQILVNTTCCVTTVYARDGVRGYTIPVHAWLCSPGMYGKTASGVWNVGAKYRYRPLLYNTNSQWAERLHGAILIHTVPYNRYGTNNTLDVGEYNKLGTPASHGCIRMQCEATKWIYDNCSGNTKVVVYQNNDPGALGKPELEPLPIWHTWDPTDPTATGMCSSHGCHQTDLGE